MTKGRIWLTNNEIVGFSARLSADAILDIMSRDVPIICFEIEVKEAALGVGQLRVLRQHAVAWFVYEESHLAVVPDEGN